MHLNLWLMLTVPSWCEASVKKSALLCGLLSSTERGSWCLGVEKCIAGFTQCWIFIFIFIYFFKDLVQRKKAVGLGY